MIVVVVRVPNGREIFVNGDYEASRAVSPEEIVLSPGAHKFETLDGQLRVDFRSRIADDGSDNRKYIIDLDPVTPPEPTS
jgi:hypothetical protein